MSDSAFSLQSNSFAVVTSGTTLTPMSQQISFASPASAQPAAQASGLTICPQQVRIVNTSTGPVYVSVTAAPRTAAIPGANPSLETVVYANQDRVFSLTQFPLAGSNPSLYVNTIAVGTSATLIVTFGEGR